MLRKSNGLLARAMCWTRLWPSHFIEEIAIGQIYGVDLLSGRFSSALGLLTVSLHRYSRNICVPKTLSCQRSLLISPTSCHSLPGEDFLPSLLHSPHGLLYPSVSAEPDNVSSHSNHSGGTTAVEQTMDSCSKCTAWAWSRIFCGNRYTLSNGLWLLWIFF